MGDLGLLTSKVINPEPLRLETVMSYKVPLPLYYSLLRLGSPGPWCRVQVKHPCRTTGSNLLLLIHILSDLQME